MMEVRTAGGALYRAMSISRQHTLRHAPRSISRSVFQPVRHISSTPARFEKKPSSDELPPTNAAPTKPATDYSSLIDSALDFTKQSPTTSQGRTSHYESSNLPASAKSKPKSSLDDLAAGFSSQRARSSLSFNMSDMLDPFSRASSGPHRSNGPAPLILPEALPAYGPSVGRTVAVDTARGMDVGRAFRVLDMNCARNRVRSDFTRQRFHERPGLKRKRLRSERWRRRFKEGFRGMVKMVSAMKKQGW